MVHFIFLVDTVFNNGKKSNNNLETTFFVPTLHSPSMEWKLFCSLKSITFLDPWRTLAIQISIFRGYGWRILFWTAYKDYVHPPDSCVSQLHIISFRGLTAFFVSYLVTPVSSLLPILLCSLLLAFTRFLVFTYSMNKLLLKTLLGPSHSKYPPSSGQEPACIPPIVTTFKKQLPRSPPH